jgi:hypothetical protein
VSLIKCSIGRSHQTGRFDCNYSIIILNLLFILFLFFSYWLLFYVVDVECGESISDVANVTFLTDVDYIQAVAVCENNTEVNLMPSDDFRSVISINYPGGPDMECQFKVRI